MYFFFFWHRAISGHFSRWLPKKLVGLCGNHWLDCIQIWYGCSLGISDDLINFWNESIENKMAAAAIQKKIDVVVVGLFFSLFLDIDRQSLLLSYFFCIDCVEWILFSPAYTSSFVIILQHNQNPGRMQM